MSTSKKALITGASGFIGRRLRDSLLERGYDVVAIRRASSPEPKEGRSVVGNYADVSNLESIFRDEKPSVVFHVAGVTKGRRYEDFQRGNVMPTQNLVAAIKHSEIDAPRFVMVSSLTSYGPSHSYGRPLKESDPRRPIEFYGQSKLEAELIVEQSGLPFTILRPGGVYGPGDIDYFELFKSIAKGFNVFFGNENRRQSCIYVDDCVRAIVDAAEHKDAAGQGYFLSDNKPLTWGQFQQAIVAQQSKKVRKISLPEIIVDVAAFGGELLTALDKKPRLMNRQKAKMGAQEAWTCSGDKAKEDFGFVAAVDVNEGAALADKWYRQNGWY